MYAQSMNFASSFYRISYCSADATYDRVFAFIATNKNETLECHAFLCPKRKMVRLLLHFKLKCWRIASQTRRLRNSRAIVYQAEPIISASLLHNNPLSFFVSQGPKQLQPRCIQALLSNHELPEVWCIRNAIRKAKAQKILHFRCHESQFFLSFFHRMKIFFSLKSKEPFFILHGLSSYFPQLRILVSTHKDWVQWPVTC